MYLQKNLSIKMHYLSLFGLRSMIIILNGTGQVSESRISIMSVRKVICYNIVFEIQIQLESNTQLIVILLDVQ